MTTAWARLKLLGVLESLGDRVLYYDTDSVYFRCASHLPNPPTGNLLGELTPVFTKRCVAFVALGSKNYGYLLEGEDSPVVKVRGLSFNRDSSRKYHFELMKQIVDESLRINCDDSLSPSEKEVLLDPVSGFWKFEKKVERFTILRGTPSDPLRMAPSHVGRSFKAVFDKRWVDWHNRKCLTFPFGY